MMTEFRRKKEVHEIRTLSMRSTKQNSDKMVGVKEIPKNSDFIFGCSQKVLNNFFAKHKWVL